MRLSLLSILFIALDLASKYGMQMLLQNDKTIPLVGDFFRFSLHYNTGIALSLPVPWIVQIGLSMLIFCAGGLFLYKNPPQGNGEIFALSLIIGGAIGNFIERLLLGKVTDFLAVWQFPVFNLADSFLFCGVCILFFLYWRNENHASKAST